MKIFILVLKKILKYNLRYRKNRKKKERIILVSVNNIDILKISIFKLDSNMYFKGSELVVYLLIKVVL